MGIIRLKKRISLFILVCLLLASYAIFFSCQYPKGFVSDPMFTNQYREYCKCLFSAVRGKDRDIIKFSTYTFQDGTAYTHGDNVLALINYLGDKKYASVVERMTSTEKMKAYAYISVVYSSIGYDKGSIQTKLKEKYPLTMNKLRPGSK